jgi:hypothetical protein
MTSEDHRLKANLRQWQVPVIAADAAERILSTVTAQPQARSWQQKMRDELTRGLSNWRYGLGYKLAAGAACLLLGFGLGGAPADALVNIADVALMADAAT